MKLHGSMVALVTPFHNGKVDIKSLEKLVEYHFQNGTKAIVVCGTTGESATLQFDEHMMVVETVVKASAGRIPVIAGTGSNSTEEALMLTHHAKKVKADAALIITPYYNKPTQQGLYLHYSKIAKNVSIPIILYNVPGRTSVNLLPDTVARLSKIKNIFAIKEASGNLDQVTQIAALCDMQIISGDDALTLPILSIGGVGVISVLANIIPSKLQELIDAWDRGQIALAQQLNKELYPLSKVLFCQTNPIPVKAAMAMMGLIHNELRLPLSCLEDVYLPQLKKVLINSGLIEEVSNNN
ncbi:MAG: 4-hydroxy-tetrahydrodipicolinate synthase [Chlamydiota bacterium]|nr:4-hydroxy-tetrahydrodipicolinate synthase [Chlamydiota bacterium]